jgi:hypothetical protein
MKKLIVAVLLLNFGCEEETTVKPERIPENELNCSWKVVEFVNGSSVITKTKENSSGLDIVISFDNSKSPPEFSGHNTSNSILGNFELRASDTLVVDKYISTLMGQPEWGKLFTESFGGEMKFETVGDNLILYTNKAARTTIYFVRQ